jgi:L-gulonolactone oxidase
MRYPHFVRSGLRTLVNVVLYALSGGRLLYMEGRTFWGRYRNWSFDRRHRAPMLLPETEAELVDIVRRHERVRVCGSGHSFNDGLRTAGVNISLDRLVGVAVDRDTKRATIAAGTRLRAVNEALAEHGLAMRCLASHDAQSVAGILSTDVHSTSRGPAHLSDVTLAMRIVDGRGEVHEVEPTDELFRAAVGGIGAVGVISEITVQCVDAFDIRQQTRVVRRREAEADLERLQREHEHVSFYAYAYAEVMHLHTWTLTDERPRRLNPFLETAHHAVAALSAAWLGDWFAHGKRSPQKSDPILGLQPGSNLVLPSPNAFNRTLYHLHQELEFALPAGEVWPALDRCFDIYEELYPDHDLPFLLVEVRFTPAGHVATLLGPGAERDSAWLCLCLNQSGDVGAYFDRIEAWLRTTSYRPHLGKWAESFDAAELARLHGDRYELFCQVRDRHDPERRFANPFTDRVLGP